MADPHGARRNPWWDLQSEMGRLVDEFVGRMRGFVPAMAASFLPLNVWEDQDNVYAEAELPGLGLHDVEIYVVGTQLTIRGQRKPTQAEGVTWHRQERAAGPFDRVVTLPVEVDANRVEARLQNGVLTVRLPKAERARARKIDVKAG